MGALIPAQLALLLLAQAPSYSVGGRVTFDDGEPLAGAEVYASLHGFNPVGETVLTDSEGRFSISDLPKGLYILTATRDDIGSIFLGQTPQPTVVNGVNLSEKFPHLDFTYHVSRPVTITGAVHTSTGAPLFGVQIHAVRRVWINGKATLESSTFAAPDDLGRFRLPHLTRGRWSICATVPPAQPVLPVGVARFGDMPTGVFAKACYPEDSQSFVKLSPGQNLTLDLIFRPAYPVAVSGHVQNTEGFDSVYVEIVPEPGVPMMPSVVPIDLPTHSFAIPNVLPGRYRLTARAQIIGKPGRDLASATTMLDVGDSDQSVELALSPQPRITATIHAPPHTDKITVSLRSADDPNAPNYDAEPETDGTLRFAIPNPGRYRLVTRADLCNTDARLESSGLPARQDVRAHGVQVTPGMQANLDITFSAECGDIKGAVVDSSGNPVPHARHLILLTGTPEDPGDLFQDSADENGGISYFGLLPGKYLMWAWSDQDEWDGVLDDLSQLAPQQTVVEVRPHQTSSIRLPLLRMPQ